MSSSKRPAKKQAARAAPKRPTRAATRSASARPAAKAAKRPESRRAAERRTEKPRRQPPARSRSRQAPPPAEEPRSVAARPVPAPAPEAQPAHRPPGSAARRGIRLAGSGSSRLTIKPSPGAPRPALELSTKPRPSGQRPLSEVELDEDEVLVDAFEAVLEGERVRITAVLERTCVYVDRVGDRRLARKIDLLVEADKLPIRRRGYG